MPIYEFYCETCKNKKNILLLISQRNNKVPCSICRNIMQRQISIPGLVFKGTGFYTTDIKHKKDMQREAKKIKKKMKD